jgi:DNA primase
MGYRYSSQLLRTLRNDIDIRPLIAEVLEWPSKLSEDYFRFLCPLCSEFNCAVNPDTNLGRCFRCERNFNPIDFLMATGDYTFVEAVETLKQLLNDSRINPIASITGRHPDSEAPSSVS